MKTKKKRNAMLRAFAEQKGMCWICGEKMNLHGDWREPMTATADHVKPKSLGGKLHKNIKAAHRECNIKRGNKHAN
jgi:5-methylcytosine-specific restriction endonuclease McrA